MGPFFELGSRNQTIIIEKLKKYYEKYNKIHNTNYYIIPVKIASYDDKVNKIDFRVIDMNTNKKWSFDIKSSTYSDTISFTYINRINEKSKLITDFNNCPHFIFVFNDLNTVYIIDKKTMKWILDVKLNNKLERHSERGWYIIVSKDEIKIAANKIIKL